jgi:23S rRNA G2445 N2-methylase RlmL
LIIGFVGKSEQTGHPAQKPLAVYDKLIRMVTVEGDLIFDPMCGSGTTGVVATVRRRRAILNDRDPKYVVITRDRLKWDLTKLAAKLDEEVNNRERTPPKTARALNGSKSVPKAQAQGAEADIRPGSNRNVLDAGRR